MAKIKFIITEENGVVAYADVFHNGALRRITAKAELSGEGNLDTVEAWRQATFKLFSTKVALQEGASEPGGAK